MKRDHKHRGGQPPTQRQLRVGEEIRHALSEAMGRLTLNDPELDGVSITVTEVRVSPDLRNATAFVIPLGGGELGGVVEALNRAAGYFRGQVGHVIRMRSTPRIGFEADTSFDEADKIEALLHRPKVQHDLHPEADDADDDFPEDEADD